MLEAPVEQSAQIRLGVIPIGVDGQLGATGMVEPTPGADEGDVAPERRLPGQDVDPGAVAARIEADEPQRLDKPEPAIDLRIRGPSAHRLASPSVGAALGLGFFVHGQMRLRSAGVV